MGILLLFFLTAAADMLFTIYGISCGYLYEINPLICAISDLTGLGIIYSIVAIKIISCLIATWFIFSLPKILNEQETAERIKCKLILNKKFPEIVLLTLTFMTFIGGLAFPAIMHLYLNLS